MADVDVHQLAREVEELLAVRIPEIRTLGLDDIDRIDQPLGRPRMKHVFAVVEICLRFIVCHTASLVTDAVRVVVGDARGVTGAVRAAGARQQVP